MKSNILSFVIILSLLTFGALGFLGLGFFDHSGQHSCPVSLLSGGDCPPIGGNVSEGNTSLAFHHISVIQELTHSIASFNSSSLVLSLLFLFASLVMYKFRKGTPIPQFFSYQTRYRIAEFSFIVKRRLLRWLALHYKRDPRAFQWVYDVT